MQDVFIYGNGSVAELSFARLDENPDLRILGFAVDREFIREPILHGLPVVPFDEVARHFAPGQVLAFMGMGHARVNQVRANRFLQIKALGYEFLSFANPTAKIWPEATVGEGCSIGDGTIVHPYAQIGDNVRIGTRCIIGHHTRIGEHSFLAVNVVTAGNVVVEPYCFLGASVTLRDGISVGASCVIGAGTTLVSNAPPHSVWTAPAAEKLPITSDRLPSSN